MKNHNTISESELDELLNAYFSEARHMDVLPDELLLGRILSTAERTALPSPYLSLFSRSAQRFAFTFAFLLVVMGTTAGALETNAFAEGPMELSARIPVVREAFATEIEEAIMQKERSVDDQDVAPPELESDPALVPFDVYHEIGS